MAHQKLHLTAEQKAWIKSQRSQDKLVYLTGSEMHAAPMNRKGRKRKARR